MPKIFIDSDVCLDVLVKREPFLEASSQIFTLIHSGKVKALVSTIGLINVHYFLRKDVGNENAKTALIRFKTLVKVEEVTDKTINEALISNFNDFEDAVQYLTAKKAKADCIITRNIKDFKNASIPVYTPEQYLKTYT